MVVLHGYLDRVEKRWTCTWPISTNGSKIETQTRAVSNHLTQYDPFNTFHKHK